MKSTPENSDPKASTKLIFANKESRTYLIQTLKKKCATPQHKFFVEIKISMYTHKKNRQFFLLD